jgi:hypothetical protein
MVSLVDPAGTIISSLILLIMSAATADMENVSMSAVRDFFSTGCTGTPDEVEELSLETIEAGDHPVAISIGTVLLIE